MRRSAAITAAALALLAAACKTGSPDCRQEKIIMVSIEPQRNITNHLVDSSYTVRTLLSKDANPETFEPSMKERMRLDSAALFLSTGVLPFEASVIRSACTTPVADTSEGVSMIYDTHGHHDGDASDHAADPHYWSSVDGARMIARNAAKAITAAFPEDSTAIATRLAAYEAHLDSLYKAIDERLVGHRGETFAVWHPSLSYFAREYGLKQISLGTEGKEMSAKGLRDAIDKAKSEGVRVFFFQKEFDSRQAVSINEGIGSRIVSIYPLDYDWEGQLNSIADEIARP